MSGMYHRSGAGRRSTAGRLCAALAFVIAVAVAVPPARATELPVVRVGVLKFGTVSWELDVMRRHDLDRAHGVAVEPLELAGKDGAAVGPPGGAGAGLPPRWV